jgi:3'-5' exoribonuclease
MERIQVKDLKTEALVTLQNFMVSDIKVGTTKAGKEFASFKVSDKTGSMAAVWWDYGIQNEPTKKMLVAGVMQVGGSVSSYNNALQLKVEGLAPSDGHNASDFEKCSKYDPEEMWTRFMGYVKGFDNDHFKSVSEHIVDMYGEEFKVCAAATGMHHAFKYGLLEHTLQMLDTGEHLLSLPFYKEALNRDLCLFGLMMHDFGKIFEYGPPPDFKKTARGAKIGHISEMNAEIAVACRYLCVPTSIEVEMRSIVLSHHRQIGWGSPVSFSSPEAAFVHYIDNLHGDVFGIIQKLESDTTADPTVKQGYGSDAYTIVKKRMDQILIEEGAKDERVGF